MIIVVKLLYNANILLTMILIFIITFKSEGLVLKETAWEQILSPLYFYMTEMLLIAIVSFIVLINSFI